MDKAFPSHKASAFFADVRRNYGKMLVLKGARIKQPNQAIVPVQFERGILDMQLTLGADQKVDGLLFLPHKADIPTPKRHQTVLSLPVSGRWIVLWGGDTRKLNAHHDFPNQRFALDLLGLGEDGKTYKGSGRNNEDYYAFGRDVLAPSDGVVTDVIEGVRDNDPGSPNQFSALGNAVFIEHRSHEISVLAHLKLGTVKVRVGENVKRGQPIGVCGNSGNSSEPHLHFHLQNTPVIQDGAGIKIFFDQVLLGKTRALKRQYSPLKGDIVSSL